MAPKPSPTVYLGALVCIALLVGGCLGAAILNTDGGRIRVGVVAIPDGAINISGLLYVPPSPGGDTGLAAVVLAHGISESKETLSGIALALAEEGFVALSIDLEGHGASGGQLGGSSDSTFGLAAAVDYVRALPYVDPEKVGLVGHSLGAGAAADVLQNDSALFAVALIGGGVPSQGSGAVTFNATFPKDLLVVIGTQDVLFNLAQEEGSGLPAAFGDVPVVPSKLYGSFGAGSARELFTPATTHLLETLDPSTVSMVVEWFESAVGRTAASQPDSSYLEREGLIFVSLIGFVGLVFPLASAFFRRREDESPPEESPPSIPYLSAWKTMAIWGILNMACSCPWSLQDC